MGLAALLHQKQHSHTYSDLFSPWLQLMRAGQPAKMSSGRARAKGRGSGHTMQLPGHVQNAMNKEERLLQQTLEDLKVAVDYRIKSISQDQQIATKKLITMEKRLLKSQARSTSIMTSESRRAKIEPSRPSTSSSLYYKSLLTPTIRLQENDRHTLHRSMEETVAKLYKRKRSVSFRGRKKHSNNNNNH